MKKYLVLQGVQNQFGMGDIDTLVSECETLEEAQEAAESVKDDTEGWVKQFRESYLVTEIHEYNDDEFIDVEERFEVKL